MTCRGNCARYKKIGIPTKGTTLSRLSWHVLNCVVYVYDRESAKRSTLLSAVSSSWAMWSVP